MKYQLVMCGIKVSLQHVVITGLKLEEESELNQLPRRMSAKVKRQAREKNSRKIITDDIASIKEEMHRRDKLDHVEYMTENEYDMDVDESIEYVVDE